MRSYVRFEGLCDLFGICGLMCVRTSARGRVDCLQLQVIFFFLSAFDICKG
jgi:hypothetical protein